MSRSKFIALAAMTLDGRIARKAGEFTNWTSAEDKAQLHRELDSADAIVVGRTTYTTAREALSKRRCIIFTRSTIVCKEENDLVTYLNPAVVGVEQFCKEKNYSRVAVLGGTETYTYFF